MSNGQFKEKREFFRFTCEKPVQFKELSASKKKGSASKFLKSVSKNLSVSGILFTSTEAPKIKSVVALKLDYRTTNICHEIEEHALIVDNTIVGRVVRIDANDDGTFDVGVAFLKRSGKVPDEIKDLVG